MSRGFARGTAYPRPVKRRADSVLLLLALAGCTRPNAAFDEPGPADATTTLAGSTTNLPTTTAAPAGTSTGALDGDADASAGDLTTTAAVDASTAADASTTAVDPTTGGGTTTTGDDASTGPAEPEHLQLYDPGRCEEPLWCYKTMEGVFSGVGARTSSQACFTPGMSPPFGVTRVGYIIAASFGNVGGVLEIYGDDGDGPGDPIATTALQPDAVTPGAHAIVYPDPILVQTPRFCVGLTGGRPMPSAGLGVAVDPEALVADQSFLRMQGPPGCSHPDWVDLTAVPSTPSGAWCIDVDVADL